MFSFTQDFSSKASTPAQAGRDGEASPANSGTHTSNDQTNANADLFLDEMAAFLNEAEVILPDAAAADGKINGKSVEAALGRQSRQNPETVKSEMTSFLSEAKVVLNGPEDLANPAEHIDVKKPVVSEVAPEIKPAVYEAAPAVKPVISEEPTREAGAMLTSELSPEAEPENMKFATAHDKAVIQEVFDTPEATSTPVASETDLNEHAATSRENRSIGQNHIPEAHSNIPAINAKKDERFDGRILGQSVATLNAEQPRPVDGEERSTDIQNLIRAAKPAPETAKPADSDAPLHKPDKVELALDKKIEKPDFSKMENPGHSTVKLATSVLPSSITSQTDVLPGIVSHGNMGAPTTINSQPIVSQIIASGAPAQKVAEALAMVTQKQDKLVVRLDPPELGRVSVEFQFETNRGVTAVISAENADIGSQLREKSEFFFKALKSAGFEDVNLSFNTSSNSSHKEGTFSDALEDGGLGFYRAELDSNELNHTVNSRQNKGVLTSENLNILL